MKLPWTVLLLSLLAAPGWADPTEVVVTGNPATADFVRQVLTRHQADVPAAVSELRPGQDMTTGSVHVTNRPLPSLAPAMLGFSDHPERVADTGVLFWGGLLSWRPVRLQYYHEGAPAQPPHVLSLFLDNPGQSPVSVHVISGTAGPCPNPIDAGHASGREFLRHLSANEGEVVSLAPGETVELFRHALPPQQTVSGLVQMTLLTPGQVHYHVISRHTADEPVAFPTIDNPADVHAKGAFTVTEIRARRTYDADAPDAWISIGNHAPENVLVGKSLAGDYGITYDMTVTLRNPTSHPAVVSLAFQPRGGSATGTFVVDGRLVDVPLTPAKGLKRLASYTLAPHQSVTARVLTIPEGASSYPVRLVCHTTVVPPPKGAQGGDSE